MRQFIIVAIIAAIVVCASALQDDDLVLSKRTQFVVNNAGASWEAGDNEVFRGVTYKEAKKRLGLRLDTENAPVFGTQVVLHRASLPDSFNAATQWAECAKSINNIRDQAQCGSCWAFAATESFADRVCIASKGQLEPVLSPQELVSCDNTDYGCQGGYLQNAWAFMEQSGVPLDSCYPYTSGGGDSGSCTAVPPKALPATSTCPAPSNSKYFYAKGTNSFTDATSIATEIMTNGPVEAGFSVYDDFFNYKKGVYHHVSGGLAGGHAVKIIGWGVDGKEDYWIVNNSWGTSWGMNGVFWIRRGKNECGIESQVYAGVYDSSK